MKKTIQHISLLLAVLLTAGLSSCIKDDYADTSKDTATVNLVFDTRASGQDGSTVQGEAGEGIKTLRVIIVDKGTNHVDVNEKRNLVDAGESEFIKTLTILHLPTGNKSFYVVANEESVGLDLEQSLPEGSYYESADTTAFLQKVIESTNFPRTDIAAQGLPIAGMAYANITGTEDQNINIPITRVVAKMELTLTNATGEAFTLSQVTLGNFFPANTYLFPQQTPLTLPDGATPYTGHTFTENATWNDGQTQTFTYYFYESSAGSGAYTIALNDGSDYAAAPIMVDDTPLAFIARNTQLKVTGTIESLETEVSLSLKVVVMLWGEVTNPDITFD